MKAIFFLLLSVCTFSKVIFVFIGNVGYGKSKLINSLAGRNITKSGNGTEQTTTHCRLLNLKSHSGNIYSFIDTVGYNGVAKIKRFMGIMLLLSRQSMDDLVKIVLFEVTRASALYMPASYREIVRILGEQCKQSIIIAVTNSTQVIGSYGNTRLRYIKESAKSLSLPLFIQSDGADSVSDWENLLSTASLIHGCRVGNIIAHYNALGEVIAKNRTVYKEDL